MLAFFWPYIHCSDCCFPWRSIPISSTLVPPQLMHNQPYPLHSLSLFNAQVIHCLLLTPAHPLRILSHAHPPILTLTLLLQLPPPLPHYKFHPNAANSSVLFRSPWFIHHHSSTTFTLFTLFNRPLLLPHALCIPCKLEPSLVFLNQKFIYPPYHPLPPNPLMYPLPWLIQIGSKPCTNNYRSFYKTILGTWPSFLLSHSCSEQVGISR